MKEKETGKDKHGKDRKEKCRKRREERRERERERENRERIEILFEVEGFDFFEVGQERRKRNIVERRFLFKKKFRF